MLPVRCWIGLHRFVGFVDGAQEFHNGSALGRIGQIAGTRTLTRDMITSIRALGYEVRLAPQITKVLA